MNLSTVQAGLVVVEAELVLPRLERVLDGPAAALDGNEGLDRSAGGAPGGEVCELAVGRVTADQEAPRPEAFVAAEVLIGLGVGKLEVGLVVEARPLRALARGEAAPSGGRQLSWLP